MTLCFWTFGTTCNAAFLAAMFYLVQGAQMTPCHVNSEGPLVAWHFGPTGKISVANHLVRHKLLFHPLISIDSSTLSRTSRPGYPWSCDVGGFSNHMNNTERSSSTCCNLDNSSFGLLSAHLISQMISPVRVALSAISIEATLRGGSGILMASGTTLSARKKF